MDIRPVLCTLLLLFCFSHSHAQAVDTLIKKADTLVKKLDSLKKDQIAAPKQKNDIDLIDYTATTRIKPGSYFVLLGSDLKQEVTGPFHARKKTWIKVGAFALIEGGLFFADEPIQSAAFKLRNNNPAVGDVGQYVSDFGGVYEVCILGAFGVYSFAFNNEKMKTTTLLATQAYITGGAMEWATKTIAGRQRPDYIAPGATNPEPIFRGPFTSYNSTNSSFPSGHTTVAFTAATVFAMEYRNKIYIPIIAYSAATLIGLSRVTENRHWITDVFAAAALGYVTGRQVVNNYHRYAALQKEKKRKGMMSFNLDYHQGMLFGNMLYTFR